MKKTFTLIFALLLSVSIFAVKVTLKVDMTGQDVSKGVFVTGELNAWKFTALALEGKNIYSVTLDLNAGDKLIYYFMRNNSWDGLADYRETIPVQCANSNLKVPGGWDGDRLIVVPATDVVVNHIFSGCLTTAIQEINDCTVNEPGASPNQEEALFFLKNPYLSSPFWIRLINQL